MPWSPARTKGIAVGEGVEGSVVNTGTIKGDVTIHPGDPAAVTEADLRQAYLHRVKEGRSHLFLSGIDPSMAGNEDTRLSLAAVYTSLATLSPARTEAGPRGRLLEVEREDKHLSALEQLDRYRRLVLLGDLGSGKSTFVDFAAGEAGAPGRCPVFPGAGG